MPHAVFGVRVDVQGKDVSKTSVFCDSALRSDCIAGVWVVDCIARQGYNVSVMAPFER